MSDEGASIGDTVSADTVSETSFFREKNNNSVAPVLPRSVARPEGHRPKTAMVHSLSLEKQAKRVQCTHHRLVCLLPRNMCEFSYEYASGLALKNGWIFGDFSVVSVSLEMQHKNSSKNSRKKIQNELRDRFREDNSENSGNIRSATFLTLP